MTASVLHFTFIDLIDILLVGWLIYQAYKLIRGTIAIKIFFGILGIYLVWKLVTALQMEMFSEILGQFIGVGVIALLIVFQQELRHFLVVIGNRDFLKGTPAFIRRWFGTEGDTNAQRYGAIVTACRRMAESHTGALIVVARKADTTAFITASKSLDARLSSVLLETLFFKNSPLHDGAVLVRGNRIVSAGGLLPATEKEDLPRELGMRHRAALGMSEQTDAIVIVVSEERGELSYARLGELHTDVTADQLQNVLDGE